MPRVRPSTPARTAVTRSGAATQPNACQPDERVRTIAAAGRATGVREKGELAMSKGYRLRAVFSVLAIATASLALAATAGASSGDGGVFTSRVALGPANLP